MVQLMAICQPRNGMARNVQIETTRRPARCDELRPLPAEGLISRSLLHLEDEGP